MTEQTFNGVDDRIPDRALDKVRDLWEALPNEWDARVTTATKWTATIVLTFDDGDAFTNAEHAERMLTAVTCFGTLERNLRWERENR